MIPHKCYDNVPSRTDTRAHLRTRFQLHELRLNSKNKDTNPSGNIEQARSHFRAALDNFQFQLEEPPLIN